VKRFLILAGGLLIISGCGGGLGDPDPHYSDFGTDFAKRGATYLTKSNHSDGWGKDNCLGCHQNFKHTMGTPNTPPDKYQDLIERALGSRGSSNVIEVCSACHGTNGVSGVNRRCTVCHDQFEKVHYYKGTSGRKASLHDFNNNGKIDDFDCTVCHWQPDMDGIVETDTDLAPIGGFRPRSTADLCLTCHSNNWNSLKGKELADTNGDGREDTKITPPENPSDITTHWNNDDFHGKQEYKSGDRTFKDVNLPGQSLFHTEHEALECSQCHNPHASNNDKLIIEKVGETLLVRKAITQVDNTESTKYALIDPMSIKYFKDLKFSGIIEAENRTYDLENPTDFRDYTSLPIETAENGTVREERFHMSSFCAACHDGIIDYSPINGLGLPIDIENHGNATATCTTCHSHGSGRF